MATRHRNRALANLLIANGIYDGDPEEYLELYYRGCALMTTCGMYDSTGKYAVEVGIPAKSGSGGGIIAAARGKAGLAVYSPELDGRGNSVCGMLALKYISEHLNLRTY